MLFTRFRYLPKLAILPAILAILVLVAGCGAETNPSPVTPPNDETAPSQAAAEGLPAEPAQGVVPDGPADSTETRNNPPREPDSVLALPAPSPASGEEKPARLELPPLPALDAPSTAILQTPAEPAETPGPEEAKPNTPAALPQMAQEQPNRQPQTQAPAEAESNLRQASQPGTGQPESEARGSFLENPLREGTDDFPKPRSETGAESPSGDAPSATPVAPTSESSAKPENKSTSKGKDSGNYDPVAENGEIFVGWQKPKVALLISGRQDGYLEPCGCAGLERMKGGLTRRHSLFKTLTKDGWPVVGIDCGGLIKGFGRQAELKFHMSVDAMKDMGYSAIGLGKSDLRLPGGELLSRVASSEELPSLFVSANVAVLGFDMGMTSDHRIVEAGGERIGITSVLGTSWQKEINNSEIEMADPQAKLREVLPKLKAQSDVLVLLAHASVEESKALAAAFPDFQIVVTAGGNPEPPKTMEILPGGTKLIEVGEKGMHAIVLGIYDDGKIQYQRVPLDSRFEDSPDMKEYMRQYQQQLKRDGLAGLGIRQVPHPQAKELGKFVGSKKCESCHEPSYEVWKKSGHAKAWKTLVELEVPRTPDPECISCHVIGWHPTEYFPYESGFLSEAETPGLIDVGCENCHGPGEKHVEAEMGTDTELQKKLQAAMVVTKEQSQHDKTRWCLNCHDLDNSPDFNFEEYWPQIEHKEDLWEDEK